MKKNTRNKKDQTTPQQSSLRERKDQPLEGGWRVYVPDSGISYADYVPPEKRQKNLNGSST